MMVEIYGLDPNTSNDDILLKLGAAKMRDLRVGSQTFDVSNGTATIRMYVDESSDLNQLLDKHPARTGGRYTC